MTLEGQILDHFLRSKYDFPYSPLPSNKYASRLHFREAHIENKDGLTYIKYHISKPTQIRVYQSIFECYDVHRNCS